MPFYHPPYELTGNNIKTLYNTKMISTGNFNTAVNMLVVSMQYLFSSLLELVWEFSSITRGCGFCQHVTEEHIIDKASAKM